MRRRGRVKRIGELRRDTHATTSPHRDIRRTARSSDLLSAQQQLKFLGMVRRASASWRSGAPLRTNVASESSKLNEPFLRVIAIS